jgi:predicted transcriptional regulator
VGGGKGAVEHHLRKLVDAGLVVRHQGPGYTCFFPPRTDHRVAAVAGVLKSASARRVLAAVQARPGLSSAELAAATGLDASTVSHHVHRLAAAGLLEPTKAGRTLSIRPTGLATQALGSVAGAAA